ncbi:exported hypothetical protein [Vibrio nigripulchritudo SOn1]|uniref:Uncharacterized protein n=1 Tax=Vibrio nigripulchritudo SOn1 TaxID=1238450 RepID=A0AAV2VQ08_9VIBR|nr:hypothetical protein [Vibrio nigripulchritudo]CCO46803.1 exported hypothetical protein [Vibrio nigripulchritudo SOn1]
MHYIAKSSIASVLILFSNVSLAESESADRLGFGIYRLAMTVDAGTSAIFNFMFLSSVVLMIAALVIWGNAHKSNLPKSLAVVLAVVSLLLSSPTIYQQIAAKTVLNSSDIDAIEFLENGSQPPIPMNEENY